jgi:hypothetical protein
MYSKLFEQIYNKENRIFYHISDKKFDKFEPKSNYSTDTSWTEPIPNMEDEPERRMTGIPSQSAGCIYLSRTPDYSKYFGIITTKLKNTVDKRKIGYLYTVKLLKKVNLFNPQAPKDWSLFQQTYPLEALTFKKILNISFNGFSKYNGSLTKEYLQKNFEIMEPFGICYKKLGYDGFNVVNYFSRYDPDGECIAIFDPFNIKILKIEEEDTNYNKTKIDFYRIIGDILSFRKKFDDNKIKDKLLMCGYSNQIINKQLSKSNDELLKSVEFFLNDKLGIGGKGGLWSTFEGKYEYKPNNTTKLIKNLISYKHEAIKSLINTFNFEEKDAYKYVEQIYKKETGKIQDFSKDPKKSLFGYKFPLS